MTEQTLHKPVLLNEVIENLNIKADGIYIDATFGRGGHAEEILKRLSDQGRLIAIDRDPEAVATAQQKFGDDKRFSINHAAFSELKNIAIEHNVLEKVDGILLDCGVSSPQLDDANRGFSFSKDGPLDMRMDPTRGKSAAEWIRGAKESEIAEVLKTYGEERFAKRIANAIVKLSKEKGIETTEQLSEVVTAANPRWEKHKHPATRAFQAIRIYVNRELEEIESCLEQSLDVLAPGGRIAVISFHSLEDRIVKRFIRSHRESQQYPAGVPVTHVETLGRLKKLGKAIKPSAAEIDANPRARSSVLRVAEKIS